ncbi:hypothetical protein [Parasitella parasitica]|uniref:HTH APSES-type domain-containing protein n=1 Tax=Parasitella parasitica TaxID=35722 RepID=A0A0B7NEH6_9FUNG|nr:hypothetical protein [Parasitella parasitica]
MAQIYKATYSGVPVYEFICNNVAVMRRRSDSYLNATQILKVAEFDKPQRTRILEREVQTGQHEKVQGGYGKYQGTWVPFERGVALAEHYHVDAILRPIFDYVKGDVSPPLAPKHVTAASTRPRKPRSTEPKRKKVIVKRMLTEEDMDVDFNNYYHDYNNPTFHQPFFVDNVNGRNKRPRALTDFADQDYEPTHDRTYAQKLLQYFISDDNGIPAILLRPPADLDVNVIIDDEGHTSLHWAAAMGRLKLVNILIDLGADIYRVNYKGQTALMRSVLFTNNFDAKSFLFLIDMLKKTIFNIDKKDQTVFHHVAATASWKGKVHASRYYMECLIETLASNQSELISILNVQDVYGDTALSIAARIGNKKLVRLLVDAGASAEIANEEGMTAQDYLSEVERNNRFQPPAQASSSTSDDIFQKNDHRVELAARTKLRHTVEGLFKKILVGDRSQPPIVSQVFDGLAGNYERDLIQKDHLIKEKKNDLELAKKRLAGTEHTFEQIQYDPTKLQVVEHGSQKLSDLLVKQTLVIQKELIDSLISEYKQEMPTQVADSVDPASLLAELKQLQQDRKRHTEKLMQLLMKTPSQRHQEYKRLISMCCNVSYENVDLMLLPLLSSFSELDTPNESIHTDQQFLDQDNSRPLLLSSKEVLHLLLVEHHPRSVRSTSGDRAQRNPSKAESHGYVRGSSISSSSKNTSQYSALTDTSRASRTLNRRARAENRRDIHLHQGGVRAYFQPVSRGASNARTTGDTSDSRGTFRPRTVPFSRGEPAAYLSSSRLAGLNSDIPSSRLAHNSIDINDDFDFEYLATITGRTRDEVPEDTQSLAVLMEAHRQSNINEMSNSERENYLVNTLVRGGNRSSLLSLNNTSSLGQLFRADPDVEIITDIDSYYICSYGVDTLPLQHGKDTIKQDAMNMVSGSLTYAARVEIRCSAEHMSTIYSRVMQQQTKREIYESIRWFRTTDLFTFTTLRTTALDVLVRRSLPAGSAPSLACLSSCIILSLLLSSIYHRMTDDEGSWREFAAGHGNIKIRRKYLNKTSNQAFWSRFGCESNPTTASAARSSGPSRRRDILLRSHLYSRH